MNKRFSMFLVIVIAVIFSLAVKADEKDACAGHPVCGLYAQWLSSTLGQLATAQSTLQQTQQELMRDKIEAAKTAEWWKGVWDGLSTTKVGSVK